MNLKVYQKKEDEIPWVEQVIEMISGTKPRYKRMGKCVRCGSCCLNENCEHLIFLDNRKAYCKIHKNKNRQEKCKIYPSNPPINFEKCGYFFIDLADNKILRYGNKI